MKEYNSLLIDISKKGRKAYSLPKLDIDDIKIEDMIDQDMARQSELNLPEVGELELVRHYTLLSNKNFGVDSKLYWNASIPIFGYSSRFSFFDV